MKIIFYFILFFFSSLSSKENSVYELISKNSDLSIFKDYLDKTGLDDVLKKKIPYDWTIYAPSNIAFENIPDKLKKLVFNDNYYTKRLFTDHILAKGHDKIKTFGVGRTATADFWKIFIRQMVSANYLLINIQRYGALQITQKGETILRGEEEYFYRKIEFNTPIKEKKIKPPTIDIDTLDNEKELFSALKSKRMELARRRRVPAYIIFPDATLYQMLVHKPLTLEEMERLNGVGPQKLEKYAQAFLEVIKGFD